MLENHDLHGSAPDKSEVALVLIDVINDLEFESGDKLLPQAIEMAKAIAKLKKRAKKAGIPVVYTNDNFGRWQSDFQRLVQHCLDDNVRGKEIVEILQPDDHDYFVLKPKHSGFFSTTLDTLLRYLGAQTLILTGIATDICVLFTANDAYMRDFRLYIPADCVAAADPQSSQATLGHMERILKADIRLSTEISFEDLKANR
jgi:nicotinamidase-related amidase